MSIGSLVRGQDVAGKVNRVFARRVATADRKYQERLQDAWKDYAAGAAATPLAPWELWSEWSRYAVDFGQRSVLFWETLRQRGNNLRGGRMVIDLNSGRATVDGRGAARGPDGNPIAGGTGGRVTGTFTVPERKQ